MASGTEGLAAAAGENRIGSRIGRLRGTIRPEKIGMTIACETPADYFILGKGYLHATLWRRYWKILRLLDAATDMRISAGKWRARKAASRMPQQRILLAATEVPGREAELARVVNAIVGTTRHRVSVGIAPMAPVGKFDNINSAIARHDLKNFDWLLIVDDDVDVPPHFLD